MYTTLKTPAVLLSAMRWRESSKIIHVFTREAGCVKMVARGALRPKSDFRGVLETLNLMEIIYVPKDRQSLQNLNNASLLKGFIRIREDLRKTAIAFSALELIQKLLAVHEPLPEFFDYCQEWLLALENSEAKLPLPFLWHFLIRLSETLGFGWQLTFCSQCNDDKDRYPALLDTREGTLRCADCPLPKIGNLALAEEQLQRFRQFTSCAPQDLYQYVHQQKEEQQNGFTRHFLEHLSWHTETDITLNSLKWYV